MNPTLEYYDINRDKFAFRSQGYEETKHLLTVGHTINVSSYNVVYLSQMIGFIKHWSSNRYIVVYDRPILIKQGLFQFPGFAIDFVKYCDENPQLVELMLHDWKIDNYNDLRNEIITNVNKCIDDNIDVDVEKIRLWDVAKIHFQASIIRRDYYIEQITLEPNLIHDILTVEEPGKRRLSFAFDRGYEFTQSKQEFKKRYYREYTYLKYLLAEINGEI
jgi:hypothetical protein